MKKSKQSRKREFSMKTRREIIERDNAQCIFCAMNYMPCSNKLATEMKSIMHYIPRSKNGLGIAQNGAVGCQYHHNMLDNGNKGNREEMLAIFQNYLKKHYPDWNEKKLVYSKWSFLEELQEIERKENEHVE